MTGIFLSYTWRLVLWRWTRPHPASATSNDITGPCHDSYSFRITAFAHFTFSNVIVHSPFRHEERRKPPFFARTTHKAFHFGQYRCSSMLGCHSYSAEQDTRCVNGEENALAANSEFRHRIYQVYIYQVYTSLDYYSLIRPRVANKANSQIPTFYRALNRFRCLAMFKRDASPLTSGIPTDCCMIIT